MSYRGNEFLELVEAATGKKGRQNERGWMAVCPSHEDDSPSLSIAEGDKGLVLNCFRGCSVSDICSSLGIKVHQLFYDSGTKKNYVKKTKYEREQFEIDTWVCFIWHNQKEGKASEKEHQDFRAAESRLRQYVQGKTQAKAKDGHGRIYKKRRHY